MMANMIDRPFGAPFHTPASPRIGVGASHGRRPDHREAGTPPI
jgi:hypothetical protein